MQRHGQRLCCKKFSRIPGSRKNAPGKRETRTNGFVRVFFCKLDTAFRWKAVFVAFGRSSRACIFSHLRRRSIFTFFKALTMNEYEIFDACRRGDIAAVQQLCAANPEIVHAVDAKGFTPLILAAYNDQLAIVDFLLENGAEINAQDAAGNTALMGVCFKGYKNIAKKLLDAGADANVRNSNGAPALTFAATFGHLKIAEWLLQHGADLSLRDNRGKSPLEHAMLQENEAMIELFEKHLPSS